jgi:ABC-type sugar transport system ATPase subunit
MSDAPPAPARVALRGIVKSYGGALALRGVDLDVRGGEIHALCGENGAGKSTLMNVLGGATRPDSGTLSLDSTVLRLRDPADALRRGIAVIHQEIRLVPTLSVAENLALGNEPSTLGWVHRARMRRRAAEQVAALGFALDPEARVEELALGKRQLVEIARALGRDARVLVLDEPTAALGPVEAARLFAILDELRRRGLAIIFITHQLDEIFRLADRVTVLRDGERVGTWPVSEQTPGGLVAAMIGEREAACPEARSDGPRREGREATLRIENLRGRVLRGLSLEVGRGEIVGLTGLAGAGHEELGRLVVGAERAAGGAVTLGGDPFRPRHPAEALRRGVGLLPADRAGEGLIPTRDIEANESVSALSRWARMGWVTPRSRRRRAEAAAREHGIVCRGVSQNVMELSGGNQQKVLLARAALTGPAVLILNEPTRGVDVRNRVAIHEWVRERARRGAAVVVVSSDPHELLGLAERIVVVRSGRGVAELEAAGADENALVGLVTGSSGTGGAAVWDLRSEI